MKRAISFLCLIVFILVSCSPKPPAIPTVTRGPTATATLPAPIYPDSSQPIEAAGGGLLRAHDDG